MLDFIILAIIALTAIHAPGLLLIWLCVEVALWLAMFLLDKTLRPNG